MKMSETIKEIAPALVNFNAEVSKISKDATNPFHKNRYSTLDQIVAEVRPTLQKHGLSVLQNASGEDGNITIKTFLLHTSGEWLESDGITLKPQKNDPQGMGGAATYARRYDLCAFLSLNTGDDDDANQASGYNKQGKQSKPKQDGMNEEITTKFATAIQTAGGKDALYEKLGKSKKDMETLLQSGSKKQKEGMIDKLDTILIGEGA